MLLCSCSVSRVVWVALPGVWQLLVAGFRRVDQNDFSVWRAKRRGQMIAYLLDT